MGVEEGEGIVQYKTRRFFSAEFYVFFQSQQAKFYVLVEERHQGGLQLSPNVKLSAASVNSWAPRDSHSCRQTPSWLAK